MKIISNQEKYFYAVCSVQLTCLCRIESYRDAKALNDLVQLFLQRKRLRFKVMCQVSHISVNIKNIDILPSNLVLLLFAATHETQYDLEVVVKKDANSSKSYDHPLIYQKFPILVIPMPSFFNIP